jgi:hypothetical protein
MWYSKKECCVRPCWRKKRNKAAERLYRARNWSCASCVTSETVAYPLPIFSAFHAKPPAFPSICGASVTLIQEWNSSEKFGITDIPMPWESPTGKKAYLVFLHGRTSGAVPAALALIVRTEVFPHNNGDIHINLYVNASTT